MSQRLPSPPPPPQAPELAPKPIWSRWWVWVIAVEVVLGVVGGVVGALSDSSSDEGGHPAEPTGPTITGSTGTTAPPTPSPVIVPDVAGEQISSARADLKDAALTASIEKRYSGEPKGLVLAQTPSNGTTWDPGRTIELVVAQPLPRIPNVIVFDVSGLV